MILFRRRSDLGEQMEACAGLGSNGPVSGDQDTVSEGTMQGTDESDTSDVKSKRQSQ